MATLNGDWTWGTSSTYRFQGTLLTSWARSNLTEDSAISFNIPLTDMTTWDAWQTRLPGTAAADDLALVTGTWGTDSPELQGIDAGGTTETQRCAFEFMLPESYIDAGTITLRIRAYMLTTVSDSTATVDAEVYKSDKSGSVGSDLCATAAQSCNSLTAANLDFTVTPTGLVAGDKLLARITTAVTDAGDAGAGITATIGGVEYLLDIKG